MINKQWKLDTIEKMAKVAYKASGTVSFDDRVRADPLVFYTIIAEAAFNTMIAELPEVPMNLEGKTIQKGAADFNNECALVYVKLKGMKEND